MNPLRLLIVDDDEVWTTTFSENLRTVPLGDFAGRGFDEYEIRSARCTRDAWPIRRSMCAGGT
jgi:hypothetical protein